MRRDRRVLALAGSGPLLYSPPPMATHSPAIGGHVEGFGATARTDGWWHLPVVTVVVFLTFVVYTTWAALQGKHYHWGPYLSPFYSPLLFATPGDAARRCTTPGSARGRAWWPSFVPASPAVLILVFPGSFRFTCYYYRKAYYRVVRGLAAGLRGRAARRQAPVQGRDRAPALPEPAPLRAVLRARSSS